MEAKERKYRSILKNSGYAVIAFGVWGIVRILMMMFFDPESYNEMFLSGLGDEIPRQALIVISLVIILFLLGLDLVFRIYVGSAAIKEGNGGKKSIAYIIAASLYFGVSLHSDVGSLINYIGGTATYGANMMIMTLVDLSFCSAFFAIIYSALMLRRVRRGKAGEQA